jgi:hypothetical protein
VLALCWTGLVLKLTARGERGSPFAEHGSFASIGDAVRAVLKTGDGDAGATGAICFRVHLDPTRSPPTFPATRR